MKNVEWLVWIFTAVLYIWSKQVVVWIPIPLEGEKIENKIFHRVLSIHQKLSKVSHCHLCKYECTHGIAQKKQYATSFT